MKSNFCCKILIPNIFLLPGTVVTMRELVSKLKAPVYGLQRTLDVPVDSLAAIASCYLTVCVSLFDETASVRVLNKNHFTKGFDKQGDHFPANMFPYCS